MVAIKYQQTPTKQENTISSVLIEFLSFLPVTFTIVYVSSWKHALIDRLLIWDIKSPDFSAGMLSTMAVIPPTLHPA